MRISILNTQVPFVTGGAEEQARGLHEALLERGHDAELVNLPFSCESVPHLLRSIVAAQTLPIEAGEPDLVIGMKFPAYLVRFPNKKLWVMHQHRGAYDLWNTPHRDLPDTLAGRRARDVLEQADNDCFRESQAVYTTSQNVARRMKKYNGVTATGILHPPLPSPELYHSGRFDDYFFYVSRVTQLKRQLLAVTAMRYVKSDFKLLIAGNVDALQYQAFLELTVSAHNLEDRVRFLGPISHEAKAALVANASGIMYTPYDEDYGYVTLEAMKACKPVITCRDSGTPAEFVEDGVTGYIVEPDPREVAAAMDRLYADRQMAMAMGRNGRALLDAKNLTWDYVLDHLLAPEPATASMVGA